MFIIFVCLIVRDNGQTTTLNLVTGLLGIPIFIAIVALTVYIYR